MAWSYYVYILDLCIISYKYLILSVCHQGIDIAPQETQKNRLHYRHSHGRKWYHWVDAPYFLHLLTPQTEDHGTDPNSLGPSSSSSSSSSLLSSYMILYIYTCMHIYICIYIHTYVYIYNIDKPVVYGIILWILGLSATYSGWSSKLPWNPATLTGHNKVMSIYIGR